MGYVWESCSSPVSAGFQGKSGDIAAACMPYRTFGVEEVARYLHLGRAEVERLVKNQDIPFERHGKQLIFRKVEIDSWASPRILGLDSRELAAYHDTSTREVQPANTQEPILPQLLRPEWIEPTLPCRTKASVLREMASLAERTERVWDPAGLVQGLQAREELCSTGIPGGLALLHTRSPESFLFESSFIVLGRTVQPIPFGAPDGQPTDLFFLLACADDRFHLHALARLCLMAQKTDILQQLREALDGAGMHQLLLAAEQSVLATKRA